MVNEQDIEKLNLLLCNIDPEAAGVFADIVVELKDLREKYRYDALTKLRNRTAFEEIDIYKAVVQCDVDNFKQINDNYGHDVGDEVLKFIAKVLTHFFRDNDEVVRRSGDEFTIILNKCSLANAKIKLMNVNQKLGDESSKIAPGLHVSLSYGIAEYTNGKTFEESLKEADKALYVSKNSGKGKVTIYSEIEVDKLGNQLVKR